jgi:glutamyl-tRNA reductase
MEFVVIGLNHNTAPLEIRERIAFEESKIEEALCQTKFLPSLKEGMILSTCNRVEIYVAAQETEKAIVDLKDFLSRYHNFSLKEFDKNLYSHAGEEAVRHLFRVASSLDSMIKGEPQILGQIKGAYSMAAQSRTSGFLLNKLLHRAFYVAKRVRTETKIGNSAVSVSFVAVELAKKIFGALDEKTVLLIGAGEMCELAAQHLVSGGVEKVLVTNRTYERAVSLAQEFKGEAIPFDEMPQGLRRADIVISSTGSPHYLLRREQVAKILKERKQKPIFFIDIAVPRDIEPEVNNIENVYVYNMDDLQQVVNQNMEDREKEAQKAEAIVQEEVAKFVNWYRSLDVTPTIVALRKKFDEIRKKELEKTLSIHPDLTEKEKSSLESLTSSIINKILHEPLMHLKRTDEETSMNLYLDTLRTLFQLPMAAEDEPGEEPEEEKNEEGPNPNAPNVHR